MDNNPFAVGPGEWVTQDVKRCPICQADYTNASYSLEVRYYDEQKTLYQVCPECMRRLGFTAPKMIIATRRWSNLLDELMNYRRQEGDINDKK